MTLRIERPGITTVQDLGRKGWAHLGVPPSGAADRASHALANRLAGNGAEAAGLETSGGLVLTMLHDTTVVVAGADCDAFVDDAPLRRCTATLVRTGQRVRIGRMHEGIRSYLAVAGGISGPDVLGSRSHDTLSGISPITLREGAELEVGRPHGTATSLDVAVSPQRADRVRLRHGPHLPMFSENLRHEVVARHWAVSPHSDRVGVRLTTKTAFAGVPGELISIPLIRGAVQLTPAGELVVMVSDHPTTGGYPVIGVVDADHVDQLAQTATGSVVRLTW